jgi:hypothetical protein
VQRVDRLGEKSDNVLFDEQPPAHCVNHGEWDCELAERSIITSTTTMEIRPTAFQEAVFADNAPEMSHGVSGVTRMHRLNTVKTRLDQAQDNIVVKRIPWMCQE